MNTDTQNNKNENRGFVRNAVLLVAAAIGTAYGGVPLNNLQGTGGIAFNPLAYTAGRPWDGGETNAHATAGSGQKEPTWSSCPRYVV